LYQVLSIELEILEKGMRKKEFSISTTPIASSLRWTGKIVDLVELLYALDTCNCINNGEIGIEEFAEALSKIFGVEIKNCFSAYIDMKRRKSDSRTYFLDELKEKLNRRMVESDIRGGKYKRR
jgi:rteC protein